MKTFKFLSMAAVVTFFVACNNQNPPTNDPKTYDEGVIINGVKWATRNVDVVGTFAATPESTGCFYQWNRKVAWAAIGEVAGWDTSMPEGTEWEKANDPSPAGWRVPTILELQSLLDTEKVSSEWTTKNGVNGRLFTDLKNDNTLFLPACGFRYSNDEGCWLLSPGDYGFYWSSRQSGSDSAFDLRFNSGVVDWREGYHNYGLSVRSVAE